VSKQDLYRGKNFEYRIVYKARDAGLEAERVGRSGAGDENGNEGLKQRIADARNYLLLLAACIEEEANTDKNENIN